MTDEEWRTILAKRKIIQFSPFDDGAERSDITNAGGRAAPTFAEARQREDINLFDAVRQAITDASKSKPVVIASVSSGSRDRLIKLISSSDDKPPKEISSWAEIEGQLKDMPYMAVWETEKGFNAPELLVLSEEDILGERLARPGRRAKRQRTTFLRPRRLIWAIWWFISKTV